jgi:hypothetical protein
MLSLKNELPMWRDISKRLDQLFSARKPVTLTQACPFCGKEALRTATMETMAGSDQGLKIGFFTCLSCNENWSGPIG